MKVSACGPLMKKHNYLSRGAKQKQGNRHSSESVRQDNVIILNAPDLRHKQKRVDNSTFYYIMLLSNC